MKHTYRTLLMRSVAASIAMTSVCAIAGMANASALQTNPEAQVEEPETSLLDEVVVTAQRRSESAQKTPLAIDVISAQAVSNANVTGLTGLSRLVPAVQIVQAGGATPLYFMRGVGSLSGTSLNDPAVSISYDGVALARQYQGNGQLYDLQRVEALRGPQGTLYGRNATGGVINLLPNTPQLGETGGDISLTLGKFAEVNAQGSVNLAIGDRMALRAAFSSTNHDGYLNDGQQDDQTRSGRVQFYIEPNDDLKIRLLADYTRQGGMGGGYALVDQSNFAGYPAGTPLITAADRVGLMSPRGQLYYSARNRGRPSVPSEPHLDNEFYGVHAVVEAKTSFGVLTVIPAFRGASLDYYAANSFAIIIDEKDKQYSLEARLASDGDGPFSWVVGGFYLKDDVGGGSIYDNLNLSGSRSQFNQISKSAAVFADGTYQVTDQFRILGGIRYTDDSKEATGVQVNIAGVNPIPLNGDKTWGSTNYRVGFQYDIAPQIMAYGTVATGFHAGGFYFSNVVTAADKNSVEPEEITAYTLGVKSRLFDSKLLFNVEAFRWELTGQQVSLFTVDSQGATVFATYNAGGSTNQGVQFDVQYRPTPTTRLGAQIEYLDAVFDSLTYTQSIPVQPGFLCRTTGTAPNLNVDCSGLRPPQAPELSLNLSADQTVTLANGASLDLGLRTHYQSETITGFNYLPDDVQKAVWSHDATITFTPAQGDWSLGAYINNITDEVIKSNATHASNVQAFQLRPPRTYGLRLKASF
ncbi:TonB-dependent receptor [Brevundimonas diminuta]|uniref:TonB-dependent receptor n=1 Tax=Brevundimonas diminuta TaxID=293 RepID=UPI00168ADD24|nr:TonB-dependent receptor [Brevundimonas diminuta]